MKDLTVFMKAQALHQSLLSELVELQMKWRLTEFFSLSLGTWSKHQPSCQVSLECSRCFHDSRSQHVTEK